MIPEIDTQLAAVIKSLSDNVLPALDGGNPMAVEQMQLCLATLGLIKGHLPDWHRYQRRDLETHLALAAELARLAAGAGIVQDALIAAMGAGADALDNPELGAHEIEREARRLKDGIAHLINASRGSAAEREIAAAVLRAEETVILRSRAWSIGMGFEPDPTQIPSLQHLLRKD